MCKFSKLYIYVAFVIVFFTFFPHIWGWQYDKGMHTSLSKTHLEKVNNTLTVDVSASSPGPASCSSAPALCNIAGYGGQDCARSPSRGLPASQSQISVW